MIFMDIKKAKIYSPPGLCHGPAGGLTAPYSSNLTAGFHVMHMFLAHVIWAPSTLPMLAFFF